MFIKEIPDEFDLLAFFESLPVFEDKRDMHYAYEYKGNNGFSLYFVYHVTAGWIKAAIKYNEQEIASYLTEFVSSFKIIDYKAGGQYLSIENISNETITTIKIDNKPNINIQVTTLQK